MYVKLLAGTALVALATPAAAQTVIDTARTTPVKTSDTGQDLKIAAAGSVTVTGGDAVTVDTNNDLTVDGKIAIANANNANGVLVTGPRTADIIVSATGNVTVDETYTPTDADNDGDKDGPFAVGTNRAGIRIDGPLTGNIKMDGAVTVEGNDSFGIVAAGDVTGNFSHDGKTIVTGDNSTAISMQGISGDARLAGTVTATGANAVGAEFGGDIGGRLTVQGSVSATGYRSTTAPTDASKLDADDLLQGGSALVVAGDVARGIVFAIPPKDTASGDNDEDKDGLPDDKEGTAKVVSYGAAPAVVIGSDSRDIAIGATVGTGTNFGIINDGTISGEGVYAGVSATGMQIGGRGGAVTVATGLHNTGTISANAKGANSTALLVGTGATVLEIRNAGTIAATSGGTGGAAVAIDIAAGGDVALVKNSGTIKATTNATGTSVAIRDASGTLDTVENSGKILAGGATTAGANIAIDLSANASGATVRQTQVASGIAPPAIEGDIRFGSGADTLDLADGTMKGDVYFGAGSDTMNLSGDAGFSGRADFGGDAGILSLAGTSVFSGRLLNSQNVAVNVAAGVLDLRGSNTIASLNVGSTGVIVATLDQTAAQGTSITVGGNATFAQGAKLALRLNTLEDAVGTYSVLTAGSLTGANNLTADTTLVPFLYKAALEVSGNTISVDLDLKDTAELGLNTAEAAAFDALYEALLNDDAAAGVFLGVMDGALFQAYVQQTLPDFAGAGFDGISTGLRSFDRHLLDPEGPFDQEGTIRPMFDFVSFGGKKDRGESAAYDLDGMGFRGGVEYVTGVGAFGVSASWLWNKFTTGVENNVTSNSYEGGVHWRGHFGPVQTFARGGYGHASFDGGRIFAGSSNGNALTYDFDRNWSGNFVSAAGGASIEGGSQFFFFRPSVTLDYVRLKEKGYTETGTASVAGSEDATPDALLLTVADRTSDELGLNAGMAVGVDMFGMKARDSSWFRLEAEGGWREVLSGALGATTARYGDGDEFTLLPEQRGSGWFARLRGFGGSGLYTIGGEAGLEERNGKTGYQLRASLRFGW